jgi:hypothetical protein
MGHHLRDFAYEPLPKHVPLYFMWGGEDPAFGPRTMEAVRQDVTQKGFVSRFHMLPGLAHVDPPLDLQQRAVEVLIELASVTHPRLGEAERRAAWDRVAARIAGLAAISGTDERLAACERLFEVPGLQQQRPAEHRALNNAWFDARLQQGTALGDAVESHESLETLAEHPRAQGIDPVRRKQLTSAMSALRKQPVVKSEITAAGIYGQLAAAAEKVKGVPSKIKPLITEVEMLIKKYPKTRAARRAADMLEDLRRQVR